MSSKYRHNRSSMSPPVSSKKMSRSSKSSPKHSSRSSLKSSDRSTYKYQENLYDTKSTKTSKSAEYYDTKSSDKHAKYKDSHVDHYDTKYKEKRYDKHATDNDYADKYQGKSSQKSEKFDKYESRDKKALKSEKYDRYDDHEKSSKYEEYDKGHKLLHDKNSKYANYDKGDKYSSYGKSDKYAQYEKSDKYDNYEKDSKYSSYEKPVKYSKFDQEDKYSTYEKGSDKYTTASYSRYEKNDRSDKLKYDDFSKYEKTITKDPKYDKKYDDKYVDKYQDKPEKVSSKYSNSDYKYTDRQDRYSKGDKQDYYSKSSKPVSMTQSKYDDKLYDKSYSSVYKSHKDDGYKSELSRNHTSPSLAQYKGSNSSAKIDKYGYGNKDSYGDKSYSNYDSYKGDKPIMSSTVKSSSYPKPRERHYSNEYLETKYPTTKYPMEKSTSNYDDRQRNDSYNDRYNSSSNYGSSKNYDDTYSSRGKSSFTSTHKNYQPYDDPKMSTRPSLADKSRSQNSYSNHNERHSPSHNSYLSESQNFDRYVIGDSVVYRSPERNPRDLYHPLSPPRIKSPSRYPLHSNSNSYSQYDNTNKHSYSHRGGASNSRGFSRRGYRGMRRGGGQMNSRNPHSSYNDRNYNDHYNQSDLNHSSNGPPRRHMNQRGGYSSSVNNSMNDHSHSHHQRSIDERITEPYPNHSPTRRNDSNRRRGMNDLRTYIERKKSGPKRSLSPNSRSDAPPAKKRMLPTLRGSRFTSQRKPLGAFKFRSKGLTSNIVKNTVLKKYRTLATRRQEGSRLMGRVRGSRSIGHRGNRPSTMSKRSPTPSGDDEKTKEYEPENYLNPDSSINQSDDERYSNNKSNKSFDESMDELHQNSSLNNSKTSETSWKKEREEN